MQSKRNNISAMTASPELPKSVSTWINLETFLPAINSLFQNFPTTTILISTGIRKIKPVIIWLRTYLYVDFIAEYYRINFGFICVIVEKNFSLMGVALSPRSSLLQVREVRQHTYSRPGRDLFYFNL